MWLSLGFLAYVYWLKTANQFVIFHFKELILLLFRVGRIMIHTQKMEHLLRRIEFCIMTLFREELAAFTEVILRWIFQN